MSSVPIIILVAVCAFAISVTISFFATRKAFSQRLHFLSEFVPDNLVTIEKSDYCMAVEKSNENVYIIGFGNNRISFFKIDVIGGQFTVEKSLEFSLENMKSIELYNMRTKTILTDENGNSLEINVTQQSSKELFADFPCDIDLNDSALRYYDFAEKLSKILSSNSK